jgi:NADPH:quinone reductase-like Zn-dependent oxidoreductase
MRAAGVRELGGDIQLLDLPDPRTPGAGEVLIEVRAAGVGNWDEYVRTGGWDTGTRPPMALGVEASGVVVATGPGGGEFTVGVATGQTVLVHGAGGVTGGLLVQLAARAGAEVIATGSPAGAARIAAQGARDVIDYHDPAWPEQVRSLTGGGGVDAALNAARDGAAAALLAVRPGGALATITGDPPEASRGIGVTSVVVTPDGRRLGGLARLLADGVIGLTAEAQFPLDEGAAALARVRAGTHGTAVVIKPAGQVDALEH